MVAMQIYRHGQGFGKRTSKKSCASRSGRLLGARRPWEPAVPQATWHGHPGSQHPTRPARLPPPLHAATPSQPGHAPAGPPAPVQEPLSKLDVDAELWQVLDLCSDEELEAVYAVLHAPSPFSPVVKSLVTEREPPLVARRGRLSLMHKVEARFRFLAADQEALLRGARPSYRDTLLAIRDRIDVPCSTNLCTFDLETEVFLHVLNNCLEYVADHEAMRSGGLGEAATRATLNEGDGMSAAGPARPNWVERVTAPIMFGVKELIPTLAKLGSALTVTAVGRSTAAQLGAQLVSSHARYQSALHAVRGAAGALGGLGRQRALEGAARGLQAATAQYSALQGALSFIGPVMWGWLAVDLAYKAIGTDYARIIRAVFILAQARLVRTHGFTNPTPDSGGDDSKRGGGGSGGGGGGAGAESSVVVHAEAITTPPYHGPHDWGAPDPSGARPGSDDEDEDPHAGFKNIYN